MLYLVLRFLKFMVLHNPQLVEKLILPEIPLLNDKLILRTFIKTIKYY